MTRKSIFISVGLLALGVAIGSFVLRGYAPSDVHAALAGLTIFIGGMPIILFFSKKNKSAAPLFECSCLYYAGFFGATVFLSRYFWGDFWRDRNIIEMYAYRFEDIASAVSTSAQFMVLAGLIAYVATFYGIRHYAERILPKLTIPGKTPGPRSLELMAWVATILHASFIFFPAITSLPSLGQFARPIGYFALGLFIIGLGTQSISRYQCLFALIVVFPVIIVKVLLNGALTDVLWYFVVGALVLIVINRRPPWKTGLAILMIAFFSYSSVHAYRGLIWKDSYWNQTYTGDQIFESDLVIDKLFLFAGLLVYSVSGLKVVNVPDKYFGDIYNEATIQARWRNRTAHTTLLAGLMEQTPSKHPHWKGESYAPLAGALIPRALWPNKPREVFGGEFGNRYWGMLKSNSVNVPWLIELYGNFGRTGAILGMALIGLLFACLDRLLNSREAQTLAVLVGLTVMLPWVYPESNFSLMVGSSPLLLLAMVIFVYVLGKFTARFGPARASTDG